MRIKRLTLVAVAAVVSLAAAATVWASRPIPTGEDFDGVTAPALPANWVASQPTNVAGVAFWVTSATLPDAGTNDAFSPNANDVLDNRLESPSFTGSTDTALLSFRSSYNLESGFDGAVLEISISTVSGGAFQDIITAGGTFTAGGYTPNMPISANFGSVIGGRSAWTGNSGGYLTTTVNLPASAIGATVKLRWRLASDNSYAGINTPGWRIDTIGLCPIALIACLQHDITASTASSSAKTVLNNQLYNAQNYFNQGTTYGYQAGCSVMNSFKQLDTSYSNNNQGITPAMAAAWNARADVIRATVPPSPCY